MLQDRARRSHSGSEERPDISRAVCQSVYTHGRGPTRGTVFNCYAIASGRRKLVFLPDAFSPYSTCGCSALIAEA